MSLEGPGGSVTIFIIFLDKKHILTSKVTSKKLKVCSIPHCLMSLDKGKAEGAPRVLPRKQHYHHQHPLPNNDLE